MEFNKKTTIAQARHAKHHVSHILQERPEIAGIGISKCTEGGYAVKIHLSSPLPKNLHLPDKVENVCVVTEFVGKAYAF
jgi:hypothetical protein